jgi:hypothetical protein
LSILTFTEQDLNSSIPLTLGTKKLQNLEVFDILTAPSPSITRKGRFLSLCFRSRSPIPHLIRAGELDKGVFVFEFTVVIVIVLWF